MLSIPNNSMLKSSHSSPNLRDQSVAASMTSAASLSSYDMTMDAITWISAATPLPPRSFYIQQGLRNSRAPTTQDITADMYIRMARQRRTTFGMY